MNPWWRRSWWVKEEHPEALLPEWELDEDDERYRPREVQVEDWIAENEALAADARHRREAALASPHGLPHGWELEKYLAYMDKLQSLHTRRAIFWGSYMASYHGHRLVSWIEGRRALGLDEQIPPFPQPEELLTLYRFFAADGSLLYIGQTVHAYERIYQHSMEKRWFAEVTSVTFERVPGREIAQRETDAIWHEQPRYNITHRRRRVDISRNRGSGR